ncbi:MAG: hypothetical protein ACMVP2_21270 [Imperialibacter sp.]
MNLFSVVSRKLSRVVLFVFEYIHNQQSSLAKKQNGAVLVTAFITSWRY